MCVFVQHTCVACLKIKIKRKNMKNKDVLQHRRFDFLMRLELCYCLWCVINFFFIFFCGCWMVLSLSSVMWQIFLKRTFNLLSCLRQYFCKSLSVWWSYTDCTHTHKREKVKMIFMFKILKIKQKLFTIYEGTNICLIQFHLENY